MEHDVSHRIEHHLHILRIVARPAEDRIDLSQQPFGRSQTGSRRPFPELDLEVIKPFLGYVRRSGFAPFAWYRIVLGAALLAAVAAGWM